MRFCMRLFETKPGLRQRESKTISHEKRSHLATFLLWHRLKQTSVIYNAGLYLTSSKHLNLFFLLRSDSPSVWRSDTAWISLEKCYPLSPALRPVKVGHTELYSDGGYRHTWHITETKWLKTFTLHACLSVCINTHKQKRGGCKHTVIWLMK